MPTPPQPTLLVIPAFEEHDRLPSFLGELTEILPPEVDLLIIDDGSSASSYGLLKERCAEATQLPNVTLSQLPTNRGKGGAIRHGWAQLRQHEWVGFVDADGAIPPGEVIRLLEEAWSHTPPTTIFACRIRMLGYHVERSVARHYLGRIFATLVGSAIHPGVYDSQCGYKLLPVAAYHAVADRLEEEGFAFDVDLVAQLALTNQPMREIPINWHDISGSKVNFLRDTVRMTLAVLRIHGRMR